MNDERLARLLSDLAPVESEPRIREYFWALLALVLFVAYMDGSNYVDEQYIVEAKQTAIEKRAALFHSIVLQCLNAHRVITVAGEPAAECRPLRNK